MEILSIEDCNFPRLKEGHDASELWGSKTNLELSDKSRHTSCHQTASLSTPQLFRRDGLPAAANIVP